MIPFVKCIWRGAMIRFKLPIRVLIYFWYFSGSGCIYNSNKMDFTANQTIPKRVQALWLEQCVLIAY